MRVGVKIKPYIMIIKFLEYYTHESRYPCKSPRGCEMENQIFTKPKPQRISMIQKNLKESPRFARGLATIQQARLTWRRSRVRTANPHAYLTALGCSYSYHRSMPSASYAQYTQGVCYLWVIHALSVCVLYSEPILT